MVKGQSLVKQSWLERAISTHNYHCKKVNDNEHWSLEDTAKALKRSAGGISEDLLIASWYKTHGKALQEFKYAKDALEFIRSKKKRMLTEITL